MILIDATPLQSEHRLRGVGTYVRHLAEHMLALAPDRVRFVCTFRPHIDQPNLDNHAVKGWRMHRPAQVYWLHNEWFLRMAVRRSRPTVFHATDFNGVITAPNLITVATLHDVTALSSPVPPRTNFSGQLARWRWQVYFRKLRNVHHIIAVSSTVKAEAIKHLDLDPDRISVIYPGVDDERFSPRNRQAPPLVTGPYALWVGAPDPNKNLPRLLEACGRVSQTIPDFTLVMAGAWPRDRVEWLERATKAYGCRNRVRFLGYVSAADLPNLYAHAQLFVFPSTAEGFGSPLVEAMASGVPVITGKHGALAEVAGRGALTVDPYDVQALAAAVTELWIHAAHRETLALHARKRAASFSWRAVAERTLAVYDRALTMKPHVGRRVHGGPMT